MSNTTDTEKIEKFSLEGIYLNLKTVQEFLNDTEDLVRVLSSVHSSTIYPDPLISGDKGDEPLDKTPVLDRIDTEISIIHEMVQSLNIRLRAIISWI